MSKILDVILGQWRLVGYDTFAREQYWMPFRYWTRGLALIAARLYLRKLEITQPTKQSGGQSGIQDQVFIVHPDGTHEQIFPKSNS